MHFQVGDIVKHKHGGHCGFVGNARKPIWPNYQLRDEQYNIIWDVMEFEIGDLVKSFEYTGYITKTDDEYIWVRWLNGKREDAMPFVKSQELNTIFKKVS